MYFAFIDESGNPNSKDTNNQFYVLLALIMHEKGFHYLNNYTRSLRQEIWDLVKDDEKNSEIPEDFELHLKDITNRTDYYLKLKNDNETLLKVLDKIYNFISNLFAKVIAVVIPKEEFYRNYSEGITTWAFKLLVERLHRYIWLRKAYKEEFILLVMDKAGEEEDNKRRKEIEDYMLYGTGGGDRPENVIETPFIGDSKIHKGVQVADAIAYMLRRHVRKCSGINPDAFMDYYSNRYMKKLTGLFYAGSRWKPQDVIKFFPGSYCINDEFWDIFK